MASLRRWVAEGCLALSEFRDASGALAQLAQPVPIVQRRRAPSRTALVNADMLPASRAYISRLFLSMCLSPELVPPPVTVCEPGRAANRDPSNRRCDDGTGTFAQTGWSLHFRGGGASSDFVRITSRMLTLHGIAAPRPLTKKTTKPAWPRTSSSTRRCRWSPQDSSVTARYRHPRCQKDSRGLVRQCVCRSQGERTRTACLEDLLPAKVSSLSAARTPL